MKGTFSFYLLTCASASVGRFCRQARLWPNTNRIGRQTILLRRGARGPEPLAMRDPTTRPTYGRDQQCKLNPGRAAMPSNSARTAEAGRSLCARNVDTSTFTKAG